MGASLPLSKNASEKMAIPIKYTEGQYVLELGPGTGCVTKAIVHKRKIPESRLICVELGKEFIDSLKRNFPKASIFHGNASNLQDLLNTEQKSKISTVVSTLPLRAMSFQDQEDVLKAIASVFPEERRFIQVTTYLWTSPFDQKKYGWKGTRVAMAFSPYSCFVWVYEKDGKKDQ